MIRTAISALLLCFPAIAVYIPAKWSFTPGHGGTLEVRQSFHDTVETIFNMQVQAGVHYQGPIHPGATDYGIGFVGSPLSDTRLVFIEGTTGNFSEADLGDSIFSLVGFSTFEVPQLSSPDSPLYIGVNLSEWLKNPTSFNIGDVFNVTNGRSPLLPGILVGTAPISFSPSAGLTTSSTFTGVTPADGKIDGSATPEPSSGALVGIAVLGAIVIRVRSTGRHRTYIGDTPA